MKAKILFTPGILLILLILLNCTKKKDNIPTVDIVSWIKPLFFRSEYTSVQNLTKKADDGYFASGFISYMDKAITHGFVINLNSEGDTIWSRTIDIEGYPNNIVLYATQKSDTEIIIAGICSYSSFKKQRFIAWLDSEGNLKWDVLFPIADNQLVSQCKLFLLEDGSIYFASNVSDETDNTFGGYSVGIDLLDKNGQIIRSRLYPGILTKLSSLYFVNDGKLLLAGTVAGEFPDYSDFFFLLIDGSGNEIYRRSFGATTYDFGYSACSDHKGGYIEAGMATNLSKPETWPVSSSGIIGNGKIVSDTINSTASIIMAADDDGYNLIVQSHLKLYFMKLGRDLNVKQTSWMNNTFDTGFSYDLQDIFQFPDGSFSFLYYQNGPVIIKTIPLN